MCDDSALTWRKSSFSANQTNCVEVAWHKSSYSGGQTNCVEVAHVPQAVAVRDSKNAPGPTLSFPITAWQTFLAH